MPIYEYRCEDCGKTFEVFTRSCCGGEKKECPDCGSQKVKRVFSVFGVGGSSPDTPQAPPCGGG